MTTLETRYQDVLQTIQHHAQQANRNPDDITLVAVTKTWPVETILGAYAAGMRHFGENRADELAEKRPHIEATLGPNSGIVWHFIGTLQSRQTNPVADHADIFHALNRLKIAQRLSHRLVENGRALTRPLPTFHEVNISGEMSKSGVNRHWTRGGRRLVVADVLRVAIPDLPLIVLTPAAQGDVDEQRARARTMMRPDRSTSPPSSTSGGGN